MQSVTRFWVKTFRTLESPFQTSPISQITVTVTGRSRRKEPKLFHPCALQLPIPDFHMTLWKYWDSFKLNLFLWLPLPEYWGDESLSSFTYVDCNYRYRIFSSAGFFSSRCKMLFLQKNPGEIRLEPKWLWTLNFQNKA